MFRISKRWMRELISNEACNRTLITEKEVYVQVRKKVAKQKNVNLLTNVNFLTVEIGSRQKILGQEAMRPHLGNRPTGNVSAIGEAGTRCPVNTASKNYIKISKHDFCLDVPTQQKIIKK